MGKTIAFWTREKETGDIKKIMGALACGLGITEEKKAAVTALPGHPSDFLDLFDVRMPEKIRSGKDNSVGFYALLQKALYEEPNEKTVMDAGVRIINKGPILFPWYDSDESDIAEKNAVTLIMKVMKEMFDYVLVDLTCSSATTYKDLLLRNADIVVILLPQDKKKWKAYFEDNPVQGVGRYVYVIYPYLEDSVYTAGWFSHHYCRADHKVYGVAQSASFCDACMDGRLAELFLEEGNKKRGRRSAFFKAITRLTKGVMDI